MARTFSRRAFIAGATATTAAAWTTGLWTPARAAQLRRTLRAAARPAGTTLLETIEIPGGAGYRRLRSGPGWPTLVRTDLASPRDGRDDRRNAVAAFVHMSDTHLIDTQSTGRVEFVDRYGEPYTAAFRAHEPLTVQVLAGMVSTLGTVTHGPVTGRRLDFAISTGDNIDNCQHNELDWFIGTMDGGTVVPNSGGPEYEGVQDGTDPWPGYWHPGSPIADDFKAAGFPDIPDFLATAIAPVLSPGLGVPWYSTYGNHDGLLQGNLPRTDAVDRILTGDRKMTDLKPGQTAIDFVIALLSDAGAVADDVEAGLYPYRDVTPDAGRRTLTTREWIERHLVPGGGPGPHGHGYTEDQIDQLGAWYAFDLAAGVRGISLDTGAYNSGSIGQTQLDWLDSELRKAHSRYFDEAGVEVRTGNSDQLVLLFSHFNPRSMTGFIADPTVPGERKYLGDEMVAFLHRWPNVVAWVNGHHHVNEVTPYPDPSGRTAGFWDINTASHVDFPSHARIIEVVDNADGTMSLMCTMVDHGGPAAPDYDDTSLLALAALARELAANDPQRDPLGALGQPKDLNVELVLPAPFDLADLGAPTSTTSSTAPPAVATATPTFTG